MNKKHLLLCVDDEPMVLQSLKESIGQHFGKRLRIETAESGSEALEIVDFWEQRGTLPSLVISDYIMPHMKGDELLRQIHLLVPDAITILLTGEASLEGVTQAINTANLYRYIAKPWERSDLMMTLESALESYEKDAQLREQNHTLQVLNAELEQKVEERTHQIRKKNEQIEASIRYAQRIQSSILPPRAEIMAAFPEHFIFFRPRDVVSGDFYWFGRKGKKSILVAADCTGHGVPGAFMSLIGNELLHKIIHDSDTSQPAHILEQLNEGIRRVWRGERKNREGMDAAVCLIDEQARTLTFAGAKNPLCYIDDTTGALVVVRGTRRSIDGRDSEIPFEQHTIGLGQVRWFYLYSDGFQDQFGGADGKKFMRNQLWQLLERIHTQTPEAQQASLRETFLDWKGARKQIDDVLVMGFAV